MIDKENKEDSSFEKDLPWFLMPYAPPGVVGPSNILLISRMRRERRTRNRERTAK